MCVCVCVCVLTFPLLLEALINLAAKMQLFYIQKTLHIFCDHFRQTIHIIYVE